jgi:hypothetical protein
VKQWIQPCPAVSGRVVRDVSYSEIYVTRVTSPSRHLNYHDIVFKERSQENI